MQIGQYISSNGGVVTAEELAPFLDVPPLDPDKVHFYSGNYIMLKKLR